MSKKVRMDLLDTKNLDDPYVQEESYLEFTNWDQVNAFIAELRRKAAEQFGKDYSDSFYDE